MLISSRGKHAVRPPADHDHRSLTWSRCSHSRHSAHCHTPLWPPYAHRSMASRTGATGRPRSNAVGVCRARASYRRAQQRRRQTALSLKDAVEGQKDSLFKGTWWAAALCGRHRRGSGRRLAARARRTARRDEVSLSGSRVRIGTRVHELGWQSKGRKGK